MARLHIDQTLSSLGSSTGAEVSQESPSPAFKPRPPRVARFRTRLFVAVMLIVTAITLLALYLAQRSLVENVEHDLQREFIVQLNAFERAREVRHAMLLERTRALARRPRIRAAFEDDALDLLYDAARYELQDLFTDAGWGAQFYRFLDPKGRVIRPSPALPVGALSAEEEAQLALPAGPDRPHVGYLTHTNPVGATLTEIIAMPVLSSERPETLAVVVLGFKPFDFGRGARDPGMRAGIWLNDTLHGVALSGVAQRSLGRALAGEPASPIRITLDDTPHLVFSKRLNPDSAYAPAFELCLFSLADLRARQRDLRWQVLGAGALLLLAGWGATHVVAGRLSAPVEKLAVDLEEDRTQRARAEAALEMTNAELQRAARFSADASHQLKTPVTVLRAGLEELLAKEKLTPEECHEISALIHQTYRLSSLIEDLLLLSRMDAGRLQLQVAPVNLSQLIEASLDDLGALPDELDISTETDFPADLHILGEKRYTAMILQNLLENARKYNRPKGRIRIAGVIDGEFVRLSVGNTGRRMSADTQAHIFERFHRGAMGENVPGYGLGLNLARELARLHQGDLRLVRSDEQWTEFEVRFRLARDFRQTPRVA